MDNNVQFANDFVVTINSEYPYAEIHHSVYYCHKANKLGTHCIKLKKYDDGYKYLKGTFFCLATGEEFNLNSVDDSETGRWPYHILEEKLLFNYKESMDQFNENLNRITKHLDTRVKWEELDLCA